MKVTNTSLRLKEVMKQRGLRQVDILSAAKPYCQKYGIKLEKSDLSQYVNGKVEPGQEKLTILGLALNVSETWLMGYDVPKERENVTFSHFSIAPPVSLELSKDEAEMIRKYRCLDSRGKSAVLNVLNFEYDSLPGEKADTVAKEA